jgi:GNAT superfamily N-acetyltransferase
LRTRKLLARGSFAPGFCLFFLSRLNERMTGMQDQIAVRCVDRFPEPEFTELVDRLLHDPDRRAFVANFLSTPPLPPVRSDAQQVRVGAFDGETLVGWSHGVLVFAGVLHVSASAVEARYRRQGLYTRLMAAVESEALALGCTREESNHRAANSPVLIANMKAGYTIVGLHHRRLRVHSRDGASGQNGEVPRARQWPSR